MGELGVFMSIILSLAFLAQGSTSIVPEIKLETVPGKGYAFEIGDFDKDRTDTVMAVVDAEAKKQCEKFTVRYGRFSHNNRVEGNKTILTGYRQAFQCIDPSKDPYKPAPADWQPTVEDDEDVITFATRYLGVMARKDVKAGKAMVEPIFEMTDEEWFSMVKPLSVSKASAAQWRPELLGWANNPDGASHPGSYAVLKITGNMPDMALTCGYLMVYRHAPASYQVSQQSINLISNQSVANGEVSPSAFPKICELK